MLSLVLALLVGCVSDQGRLPIASTKNVEISRVDLKKIPFKRNVEGSRGRLWILFIPLGGLSWGSAMDDCLAKGDGDFMTSARLEHFWWSILLISYESDCCIGDVGNSLGKGSRDLVGDNGPWEKK